MVAYQLGRIVVGISSQIGPDGHRDMGDVSTGHTASGGVARGTKVVVVISCIDKGIKLALKVSASIALTPQTSINKPETILFTINIPILQGLMPRFTQRPPHLV